MEVVFDTRTLAAGKRRQAWRDAICEIYLQVDCQTDLDVEYAGLVQEAQAGRCHHYRRGLSPQTIRRGNHQIGRFGKDCYYLGSSTLARSTSANPGRHSSCGREGDRYTTPTNLMNCIATSKSRQFWIELPRAAFDRRFEFGRPPQLKNFDLTRGLGRIAAEFCATLATESGGLDEASRSKLGEQFMDLIALGANSEPDRQSTDEQSVQRARLRSVKSYIEANLGDPNLSLTDDCPQQWNIAALSPSSFPACGHVGFGMVAAPAIAKMPRSFDRAAARAPIDHGNRLFHGISAVRPISAIFFAPTSICGLRM